MSAAFAVRGGLKETTRHSLAATLDFKFARSDTLSLSIQASRFEEDYLSQTLTFNVGGSTTTCASFVVGVG